MDTTEGAGVSYKNRIRELRYVDAAELRKHPRNWRTHPPSQTTALRQAIESVGIVDAVLARECEDGTLELIDGHLRTDLLGGQQVPVLILDVDEREADAILATFDPLTAMAGTDTTKLTELLNEISVEGMDDLLNDVAGLYKLTAVDEQQEQESFAETWQVLIDCRDEAHQLELIEKFGQDGLTCRALIA